MKRLNQLLALAGVTLALGLSTGTVSAQQRQGRGNFDPAQFRERMMERMRDQLGVKSDDDWKLIEGRIGKVMDARREAGPMGGPGFFGRGGRPPGGPGGPAADDNANQRGRRGGRGGEPSPEVEALQKAIDSNAPADEIKAKLAKVREARKAKEADLEKAQDDLRQVLSVKQEAQAVLMGLLR